MYRRSKPLTDKELLAILENSDSEEDFIGHLEDQSDDGWIDTDEEANEVHATDADAQDTQSESDAEDIVEEVDPTEPPTKVARGNFVWQQKDFKPTVFKFDHKNSGCKVKDLPESPTELDIFQCFFTEDIVTIIAEETNKFYEYVNKQEIQNQSRLKRWKPIDFKEMYCFIAVTILMPQTKKLNIQAYWTSDAYLSTPIFGRLMKRDRYLLILRLLHFVDNNIEPVERDTLRKIRVIFDHLRTTFKNSFYPFQNLCIDESLMLYKGRVFFKQYIPSKRHRFGIKFFMLCDCETGHILDLIIYTGATTNVGTTGVEYLGKSGDIVMTLMTPYLNKGHTLFVDNWYSSPTLFSYLHGFKTNTCGIVKASRKHMPNLAQKLQSGQVILQSTDSLLALKWQNKREIRMLTSCFKAEMRDTGKIDHRTGDRIQKPSCILEYKLNMGSVDKSNMLLSSIECVRKFLNSYHLDKTKSGDNISVATFQLNLVKQVITKYHTPLDRCGGGRRPTNAESDLRLTERHFPSLVPSTANKARPTKRCVVCEKKKKRAESRYMCAPCHAALCIVPCFEVYHTKKNLT
nr:piggyBac transposable element-derived protein 4-like [Onthophagus taurus]